MNSFCKMMVFSVLAMFVFSACKKDEKRVIFEGGTSPVLTASSTSPQVLTPANGSNPAITFSWTNPNYRLNTGISSQDVSYVLQVDTAGANFSSRMLQEVSISRDLSKAYTVKELNSILSRMELAENRPHTIEFRIKSTLVGGNAPLFSNVQRIVITPYLDVAVPVPPSGELYITGSAMPSDWTNSPPAAQKFTKVNSTLYEITTALAPGKEYKFLSTLGQWQPQYGGSSATGGDLGFNLGGGSDPAAIPTPSTGGTYKITVNFRTGKYTVVKL